MKKEIKQQIHEFAEQIYKEGYNDGYDDKGCNLQEMYEKGLNDAWECARKLGKVNWITLEQMGFENKDKEKNPSWDVVMEYTASEAIDKIKEWERRINDKRRIKGTLRKAN